MDTPLPGQLNRYTVYEVLSTFTKHNNHVCLNNIEQLVSAQIKDVDRSGMIIKVIKHSLIEASTMTGEIPMLSTL